MNEQVFETVLNEIVEELKQNNELLKGVKQSVGSLEERVGQLEKRGEPVQQVVYGGVPEFIRSEHFRWLVKAIALVLLVAMTIDRGYQFAESWVARAYAVRAAPARGDRLGEK